MKTSSLSNLKLPRAVLFDYDGVLVASEPIHLLAWKQLLKSMGLPEDLKMIQAQVGNTAPKIMEALLNAYRPGWTKDEYVLDDLAQRKNDFYLALAQTHLQAYPGVRETLQWLRTQNILIAVVSNAKGRELATTLQALNLTRSFDAIISRDDIFPNKPDPAPYLFAAQKLGVPKDHCIAVEDSPPGLEAGLKAEIPTVAICTNFPRANLKHPVSALPELEPVQICSNFLEFFSWLRTLPTN